MNTVIIILLALVAVVALLLIIGLFTKNEYDIEQEVVIEKPNQKVFDYVKLLKNQDHFNKWAMMDPKAKKEYRGTDGTVGFVSAWDSTNKQVGKGEQKIVNISEGERIDYQIQFIKPFEGLSPAYLEFHPVSNTSTKVRWGFSSKMKYPMNIMLLFVNIPEILKKDMQTSLGNLKGILEKE